MPEPLYRRKKRNTVINIIPLVDVMTVLIFFFLITMNFDKVRAIEISPPVSSIEKKVSDNVRIVVALDKNGKYYLNSKEIHLEELRKHLSEMVKTTNAESAIFIADENSKTKELVYLVDMARELGLRLQLLTRSTNE